MSDLLISAAPARRPRALAHPATAVSDTPLTRTVPKEFVHRAAVAEVLLTGWERVDQVLFRMSAQWPRGHSFFSPLPTGHHAPMLAAETIRQAGTMLAHAEFGVPLNSRFMMSDLHFTVVPEHALVGGAPADLDLEVCCTEVRPRGRSIAGMRVGVVIRRDGDLVARGGGQLVCISPTAYDRLRGEHRAPGPVAAVAPVSAESVGRRSAFDVVLGATDQPHRWRLRADTDHPVLFDHPVDHAPGMLLLEAARQATHLFTPSQGSMPVSITSSFQRYVELDRPCWIEAGPVVSRGDGHTTVSVLGRQDDLPVFSCIVEALPVRSG